MNPSESGFLQYIREQIQVSAEDMPDNSLSWRVAYQSAREIVNPDIQCVMPSLFTQAVYSLGMSFLVNYGVEKIFSDTRQNLGLNNFSAGPITSASDNATSASRLVPDFYKTLSLADLQMLRDPWGRQYLMIAQQFGSLWKLT